MTRFARILLLALFLWGWAGTLPARAARAQVSAAPPVSDSLSPTDFPPYDAPIGSAQQYGLAAKALSERLAQTPDAPEMIRILGAHGRIDDAFTVLSRIVSGPPGRMVNGFVAIVELAATILPEDFKDYGERLRDLAGSAADSRNSKAGGSRARPLPKRQHPPQRPLRSQRVSGFQSGSQRVS